MMLHSLSALLTSKYYHYDNICLKKTAYSESIIVCIDSYLIHFQMDQDYLPHLDTPEKRIYQLIISRLDGDKVSSPEYCNKIIELTRKGIGGFILFGGVKDELGEFIEEMQSISAIPLFIASDIERGPGQQLKGGTDFPCQMAVAAAIDRDNPDDISLLRRGLQSIAEEAIEVGINMPLMPVMDVNRNPDNPIICTRAFSDNPEEVTALGTEYIRALEKNNLLSCVKHFPGHGDTAVDSHISLPVITKSYAELISTDILPFKSAIRSGAGCIMIGHLSVPSIDSEPSSTSRKVVTELLREKLSFDGLILTDALNMSALTDIDNVPEKCINAGADIILHPDDADTAAAGLKASLEESRISADRIDESLQRILTCKRRITDIPHLKIRPEDGGSAAGEITGRSITLARYTEGMLPISDWENTSLLLAGDRAYFNSSPLKRYFTNISAVNEVNRTDNILEGTTAVIAIFSSIAAWRGSSGIEVEEKEKLRKIISSAGRSIVISFGSPYILRSFRNADISIAAYEAGNAAQLSVIECLKGEREFTGRLPVRLQA